jgi:hypothetical protein
VTVLKKENCTVSAKTQTRINVLYAIDEASVMVLHPPKTPSGGVSWIFSAPSGVRAPHRRESLATVRAQPRHRGCWIA